MRSLTLEVASVLLISLGNVAASSNSSTLRTIERDIIARSNVSPHWLPDGNTLWYRQDLPHGRSEFVLVDVVGKTRQGGLDHVELARHLQRLTKRATDPDSLLDENSVVIDDSKVWEVEIDREKVQESKLQSNSQAAPEFPIVFVRDANVWVRGKAGRTDRSPKMRPKTPLSTRTESMSPQISDMP